MIDFDLLENGLNASGERNGTIFQNNLYSSNNGSLFERFFDHQKYLNHGQELLFLLENKIIYNIYLYIYFKK